MSETPIPPPLPPSAVRIDAPTGSGESAKLTAFSSFEPYELADYLVALKTHLPDVAVELWRMPTADLTRYLLAGARGDLILGWADTAARTPQIAERIARPDAHHKLIDTLIDADGFRRPSGFTVAFVVDPALLARCGAVPPTSWVALAEPVLADRIVFPDPRFSGAGYLSLTTLLQYFGDQDGWALMRDIDRNVVDYPGSAWAPAARVGSGEVAVGVTVGIAALRRTREDRMLAIALPAEAVGAEAEVYGVLDSCAQRHAAQRVLAWFSSVDARPHFAFHGKLIHAEGRQDALFEIDARRAARERQEVLRRFDEMIAGRRTPAAGSRRSAS